MKSDFCARANALRKAAADPQTDAELASFMMATAADMEAEANTNDAEQTPAAHCAPERRYGE